MYRFEDIFPPGGFAGVVHVHPLQEERFEVVEGVSGFQIGREKMLVEHGETLVVPAGTPHTFWNAGQREMRVIADFRPALESTGRFYEFYFGLARAGKAGKNGLPSIWQIALQADEFADHVRIASPPWWIQRLTFTLLRPIARMKGYRRLDFSETAPTHDSQEGARRVA